MTSRRVVLVRHGESEWNLQARWQGHGGVGLTERGRAQAERTAAYLERAEPHVIAILSSDLARVVETAEPARQRIDAPVTFTADWRELDVGWWSGLTHDEIAERDPEGFAAWQRGADQRIGGGESPGDLRARVRRALEDLVAAHPSGTVVVFTHGGCVRAAASEALGLDGQPSLGGVGNASISVLTERRGRWWLAAYNATGHLAVAD